MLRLYALLLFLLLGATPLLAQRTLTGRVTDSRTGAGLAGATVILKRTDTGVSTDSAGLFRLPLPGSADSATLVVSSIGYFPQERRVAVAQPVGIALVVDHRPIIDCIIAPARYEVGLSSGVRHTPAGVQASWRPPRVPAKLGVSYQTNFGRNRQLVATALSDDLYRGYWFNAGLNLEHRRLHLRQRRDLRFSSSVLAARLSFPSQSYFTLLLGGGHAERRTETSYRRGYGYQAGLLYRLNGPALTLGAVATRWPGYWQWQGSVARSFSHLTVSLQYIQIRSYRECNLGAVYPIY